MTSITQLAQQTKLTGKAPVPVASGGGGGGPLLQEYPNASHAYSLRDLTGNGGAVVRVRRDSDDAEQDFTAAQVADGTMDTFVGSGSGFVRKWYEQSGTQQFPAFNPTSVTQPAIIRNGVPVMSADGFRGIEFDGNNDRMFLITGLSGFFNVGFLWITVSPEVSTEFTRQIMYAQGSSSNSAVILYATDGNNSGNSRLFMERQDPEGPNVQGQKAFFTVRPKNNPPTTEDNEDGYQFYVNGNLEGTMDLPGTINDSGAAFGYWDRARIYGQGPVCEMVCWPSGQENNQAGIEANINNFYGIV